MGTPASFDTVSTVYDAPPMECAALSFCWPYSPMSTSVSRCSDTSATFLPCGSMRVTIMLSERNWSPAYSADASRSDEPSVPMSSI